VCWHFGSFIANESQRRLERSGQPVSLGARAFDLLLYLLQHAGELVEKQALLSAVWDGLVVEEASVRVHMSLLRKALGTPGDYDGCREWITTVPLRGYRFNGKPQRRGQDDIPPSQSASSDGTATQLPFTRLPLRLTGLIGRDPEVASVLGALEHHRLVSIVGAGGIGKTSVAIRAAECLQSGDVVQVAFVDLAPLISPDHVMCTMARSLGMTADLPDPLQAITEKLAGRDVLMLIDNCEHVLDALIHPLPLLLAALPRLRVLATSREPLRLAGESVLRLQTLPVPDSDPSSLAHALGWSSVELLVERALAAGSAAFGEPEAPLLARMSRQLDGIPLAIELVAARLGAQPIADLALRLDDHMRLHSTGYRSSLPRHRTLAATLDWSTALLDADELRVFRRLSMLRGNFDIESALGVVAMDMDREQAFDALISLVDKSLVFFDGSDVAACYRLLDTTRSYAADLLERSGERPAMLRHHARFMLDLMRSASRDLPALSAEAWSGRYAHHLDNVRFALGSCVTGQADIPTAAALVTASQPLWFHVSLVAEYRDRVAAILALVDQETDPDIEAQTRLLIALVVALLHADALDPGLGEICRRGLIGTQLLGSRELERQVRWAHAMHDMFRGEYASAWQQAQTLLSTARTWSGPAALNLALRIGSMTSHFRGRFDEARHYSEAALPLNRDQARTGNNTVGVDPLVAVQTNLMRTLWIQGNTAQALDLANEAVERGTAAKQAVSTCVALYGACPVALWAGEIELASRWIRLMHDEAQRGGLVGWLRYASWYRQGLGLHTAADPEAHVREVSAQLASYDMAHRELLATFCPEWIDDGMVARVTSGESLWVAAEVWRAAGWRSERQERLQEAENAYLRALDIARRQSAGSWELRAAMSLARLWARQGQPHRGISLLDAMAEAGPLEGAGVRDLREQLVHADTHSRPVSLCERRRRRDSGRQG
jgi:predicted ATPase/DNA-binding winged helix-turn-helix (wHTH) protein